MSDIHISNLWKLYKSLEIYENLWQPTQIHKYQWHLWTSMKINAKSMGICKNLQPPVKIYGIHANRWDVFVLEKKGIYIPYYKGKNTSHICLQTETNCLNREMKSEALRTNEFPTCKTHVKIICFIKPVMIKTSLWTLCPRRFPIALNKSWVVDRSVET